MENKKRLFNLQYLIMYLGFGFFYPFFALFLKNELKLDNGAIGLILAVGPLIGVFALPIWGIISDLTRKHRFIFIIAITWSAITVICLGFVKTFILMFIMYGVYETARSSLISLNDSITIKYANEHKLDYSSIRSFGSLGYVLGSFILGLIFNNFNTSLSIIFYLTGIFYFITIIVTSFYPDVHIEREPLNFKEDIPKVLKDKKYILIVAIGAVTISLSNGLGSFLPIYLTELGGSLTQISLIAVFGAMTEVFVLRYTYRLIYRFGYIKVLTWGVLCLLLRFFLYFLVSDVWLVLIFTIFHGLMISFTIPTILSYINEKVPQKLNATAITVYGSITGLSVALYSFIGGFLSEIIGLRNLFIVAFFFSFIGLIIIFFIKKLDVN